MLPNYLPGDLELEEGKFLDLLHVVSGYPLLTPTDRGFGTWKVDFPLKLISSVSSKPYVIVHIVIVEDKTLYAIHLLVDMPPA